MLFKISWRNIWRNKIRSSVVIVAIILGIWAGLFVNALTYGLNHQRTLNAISTRLSHIQIHNPEFLDDQKLTNTISTPTVLMDSLENIPEIKSYTGRLILNGMASSSAGGYGIRINSIHPGHEKEVTSVNEYLVKGTYFGNDRKKPVVIGQKLAGKLKVKTGSRIVLNFQNAQGDIAAGAFRITGIYKTVSSTYDELNLFVRHSDLTGLLGPGGKYHEFALLAKSEENLAPVKDRLKKAFPGLTVRTWDEISPELGYANEMMTQMLYIFILIILLALSFGIVNTMLMAVLERKKELGMLMAVGMNKIRVFSMIMLETIFLSLAGGPVGIILGYFSVEYFGNAGIDLSLLKEGLEKFGIGTTIYTSLEGDFYWVVGILVVATAIFSAIYPAVKALRLKPVEAIGEIG